MLEDLTGSGTLSSLERTVAPYTTLRVAVRGDVELVPSIEEKVVFEGDENLLDRLEVIQTGSTLNVASQHKLWKPFFTKLVVRIHFVHLDKLTLACHGNVRSVGPIVSPESLNVKILSHGDTELDLRSTHLLLSAATHGDVRLRGEAWEAKIRNASHGDIEADELHAAILHLDNMGHGNVHLHADKSLSIRNMGHGDIIYSGEAVVDDVLQFGHGAIKHRE